MRLDRLLAITLMLFNRERVTARQLAEYFEVSIRTIYRDIDAINLSGIPIVSFPGHEGGFGIMETYRIDRQVLTFKDMLSILTTLKGINITLEDRKIDGVIEKITTLVPPDKKEQLKQHQQQFVIDILPWGFGTKQKQKLKTVHQSVVENMLLEFVYRNSKGQELSRIVEPMTLFFKPYSWYLFAFCKNKEDYRIFRLTRMNDLVIQKKTFQRRDKHYQDFFLEPVKKNAGAVDLVLRFSPEARVWVEDVYDTELITRQKDGFLIARVSFPEDEWVYAHILNFGDRVEVLEPPHIREIIREKAEKIQKIYKPDIGLSKQ